MIIEALVIGGAALLGAIAGSSSGSSSSDDSKRAAEEAIRAAKERARLEKIAKCNRESNLVIHATTVELVVSYLLISHIFWADSLAIALLVGKMVIELARVYDVSPLSTSAKTAVLCILIQFAGTYICRWATGWIPFAFVGNLVNVVIMIALVELMGYFAVSVFRDD